MVANNPNSRGALIQVTDGVKPHILDDSTDPVEETRKIIGKMWEVIQDFYWPHYMVDKEAQEFTTLDYDSQVKITKALMVKTLDDNATTKGLVNLGERIHQSHKNPDRADVFKDLSTWCGTQVVLKAVQKARSDQYQVEYVPLTY